MIFVYTSLKTDIRKGARLIRGLTNVLKNDAEFIYSDANGNDLFIIEESIEEAKHTVQRIIDSIEELEYLVYLTKQEKPRK